MNHKTGSIVTKNGKTGVIIDKARIYQCWEVKWGEGEYTIERDDQLKSAPPKSRITITQPPSLVVLSSTRENLTWKVKDDNFSKFVKKGKK
tara:strand:+ start:1410 stop:1682 length:273 start_codon:yes stop_codon:yes gene_type:complete